MNDERRTQWLKGVLDLCILGALSERERYGYELAQRLEQAGLGRIKGGTLYPLLARLEAAELVTSEWRPGEQGPGRKYYNITARGRQTLVEDADAWITFTTQIAPLLQRTADGGNR